MDLEGNASNDTPTDSTDFSCKMDDLSRTAIMNPAAWTLSSSVQDARPYIAAADILFFFLGFVWNLYIIIVMLVKRHILKEPANIYLLNLVVSDFILTVTVIPISLVGVIADGFPFGSSDYARCAMCNFSGVVLFLLFKVYLHTLAMLSLDRLLHFISPLKYNSYVNWWKAVVIVSIIWFISFWIAIPPVLGFGQYRFHRVLAYCHPVWEGDDFNYVRFILIESLVPIVAMGVANVWTYQLAAAFLKKRQGRRKSIARTEADGGERLQQEDRDYGDKQKRLRKTFLGLLLIYLISWFPIAVVAVVTNFTTTNLPWSIQLVVFGWLCYITTPTLHPMIETYFIKELREEVSKRMHAVYVCMKKVSSILCGYWLCCSQTAKLEVDDARAVARTPETDLDHMSSSESQSDNASIIVRTLDCMVVHGISYKLYEVNSQKGTLV